MPTRDIDWIGLPLDFSLFSAKLHERWEFPLLPLDRKTLAEIQLHRDEHLAKTEEKEKKGTKKKKGVGGWDDEVWRLIDQQAARGDEEGWVRRPWMWR